MSNDFIQEKFLIFQNYFIIIKFWIFIIVRVFVILHRCDLPWNSLHYWQKTHFRRLSLQSLRLQSRYQRWSISWFNMCTCNMQYMQLKTLFWFTCNMQCALCNVQYAIYAVANLYPAWCYKIKWWNEIENIWAACLVWNGWIWRFMRQNIGPAKWSTNQTTKIANMPPMCVKLFEPFLWNVNLF